MTLNKTNKNWGIAAATLTVVSALIAPQAMAGSKAELGNSKVQALESQVNEMADMLRSMQSELDAVRNEAKQAPVAAAPAPVKTKDNMVFFRGGFASMDQKRNGVSIYSDVAGSQYGLPGGQADKDAWYFGAGLDFSLTDDMWGMADSTEMLAEIMFEYKEFASNVQGNALANNPTLLSPVNGAVNSRNVTVNQFSLTASPKIKFMKGSDFRPWIIPVGFALHVVSPPSESITVLNPGIMFGAGADYRIWKDLYVGVDGRYHLTSSAADGVNTDGFTAGGYLGIGF
ncbi:MAG: porin family protein [Methylococcaceae bacterium]|nr:porin family protein [Methylococcaceae bacterium]